MEEIGRIATDLLVYLANGALVIAYFVVDRAPHLASLGAALVIGMTFDRMAQQQAVFAPSRYGPSAAQASRMPRTAQVITAGAFILWLAATWSYRSLVPVIGALMWAGGLAALLVMPQQRWSLLWSTKAYLILYSLAVLAFRFYLWQTTRLSPEQLAEVFGGAEPAARVLAQNTGTFATIGSWLLWVILPAGYFGLLLQNWLVQPMSLVGPLQGAQDVLATLRTRGNGDQMPGS